MKVLLVSPLAVPINPRTTYSGIERLVWVYSGELLAQGQEVAVVGHRDSVFPEGVEHLKAEPMADFSASEIRAYQTFQYKLRSYDVIHDFSHLHLASRTNDNLPSLNIFWHAPALAKYPKAPYNIIAPSQWAAREFKRIYHQEARAMRCIAIDPALYHPDDGQGSGRFLAIGRNDPEKGNLNAVNLCRQLGLPLDIIAARGLQHGLNEPLSDYEKLVRDSCDGKDICFLGDVSEFPKIALMQRAKALLYITDHPEVTSHKDQEAMCCGCPVICTAIGAAIEVVEHGITGFLGLTFKNYEQAIADLDSLDRAECSRVTTERWNKTAIVKAWLPLYQAVANGERW